MAFRRNVVEKAKAVDAVLAEKKPKCPRVAILWVEVDDQSGSTRRYWNPMAQLLSGVRQHFVKTAGQKAAQLIYVLRVVISGGVVASEIATLDVAKDPEYSPGGQTPMGRGLNVVCEKVEAFIRDVVLPNEVSIRNFEVLTVGDCHPTGESAEETAAGVAAFLALLKRLNGKVTVVGTDAESTNMELARQLDVNERGVRFLGAEAQSVVSITFDSLLSASRKLGVGSNPLVQNG